MDSTRIEANSKTALQFLKEEELVLRECLYALQGVTSGERIHFDSVNKQHVTIRSEVIPSPVSPRPCIRSKLGSGALDALSICAEAGWLYRRIQAYVWRTLRANNDKKAHNDDSQQPSGGSIQRALASALQLELQSYQQFLAQQLPTQLSGTNHHLRHLLIAIQAPIHRLKLLAAVTDGIAYLHGPQLLQALHQQATRHGDARHRLLVEQLLSTAARPWFDLLFVWTTRASCWIRPMNSLSRCNSHH